MDLNFFSILYLFFRLAPFLIVAFFTILSIFNQDMKGFIYLTGIITTCISISGIQQFFTSIGYKDPTSTPNAVCQLVTIGNREMSNFPIGQAVIAFTFAYLFKSIRTNSLPSQNITTMTFFPLLLAADFAWNVNNGCVSPLLLFTGLSVGYAAGELWGFFVQKHMPKMQYFLGASGVKICSMPSKTNFKCRMYKSGVLQG